MERTSDIDEPVIGVSMDSGRIVIRPVGHLDEAALDALRSLLEGARAAGAVAVVDLAETDLRQLVVEARQSALSQG